ncbi:error-prone DNA polymerase [Tsukamurella sp. 8F]|uniref:error-prone DNA polymerase n=1 Tax=unclassified Tsukamurella TaxID=2633480 RepID=UPI0023B9D3DB|nr:MULTISPECIES: error-prone DNA polymerase [unclassified Tsukamurella]MDF0532472.1 error-prone DNA polymerase [Tsukamurella sp. 8J]MDF0589327.1 error-prone DNA polymerase [Tsukamurella sp. 8F]
MGFESGPRWSEMERMLAGRPAVRIPGDGPGDGGDAPGWSRKRDPYVPLRRRRGESRVPYAELHAHSAFSFLDGAALPEDMAEQAHALGLRALAITDHNGFYGVVRFAQAAKELRVPTVFGAELSLARDVERVGATDPEGAHLLVLAKGPEGYRRLSRVTAAAHMAAGEKGRLRFDLDELEEAAGGHWHILTGCRKGTVRRALETGADAATSALGDLVDRFGVDNVSVELTCHGGADDDERNHALAGLVSRVGLTSGVGGGRIATTGAHFAYPRQRRLAMTLAAIRARRTLDEMDGWLPAAGGPHLRSGDEMALLLPEFPGAIAGAVELAAECAFDLDLVAPNLPPFDVPDGHTEETWLRELVRRGAREKYGSPEEDPKAHKQIEHELAVIEKLEFPGYFLIVHDIVRFCHDYDIMCQGRGSAVNSAVCYALGITTIDPVAENLLFERFLAPDRDGDPDIDVDIESDRREEVIQYVYGRYGRQNAAQVANVITYRGRSSIRDVARALGFSQGQQDAWSKSVSRHRDRGETSDAGIPDAVVELADEVANLPRHLGIHSGGMVICDRPIADVCPTEWARMENRSILQWDKDDCAAVGLVKFDLLGLGMLSALHYAVDLLSEHKQLDIDFSDLRLDDPQVYEMLGRADSVGVFQVESRAQMATLPRLKPKRFYDLVVEVALIRPGPIQGGSVHPYIRRYNGLEEPRVEHESMWAALDRTLGVPLFQEQLMQLSVDVAGFTAAEADQLRRAMGAKRSPERMERLRERFYDGARRRHDIGPELAGRIFEKLCAFANFGFPESHAQSFASLVYYSSWLKLYHPAAFCAALLRAQPMGFYSPQSLIADARRHGVTVHRPDVNRSLSWPNLEREGEEVRLGLAGVRGIGDDLAERIVEERDDRGPFADLLDLTGRVELTAAQAEALATAGAFACFGGSLRQALWAAGAAARERPDRLPGMATAGVSPMLPGLTDTELAAADVWATGVTVDVYPTQFLRPRLDALGVVPADRLLHVSDGARVLVGGAVTHRQRPATAGGVTFVNLEDETGMVNVMCSRGLWARYRMVAQTAPALLVRGTVQNAEGVVTVVADRLQRMDLSVRHTSRDWQ